MKFRAGDLEFSATVSESSDLVSPQSGAQLKALTIQFRAQKSGMHEQALDAAQARQSGGLFSLTESDTPELEWRVRESGSQYVGTEPWGVNHHIWRIEQVERLACERLTVGSVRLVPYEYVEAVDDSGIVRLAARAQVTDVDLEGLAGLESRVDVIRHGISETPRTMSMDYVWGPNMDGVAVAVRCQDLPTARVTLSAASIPSDPLQDLLDLLLGGGILSDSDREELRSRRHAARRVADLDEWNLND